MSHTRHRARTQRLQRSTLAVPGSNPALFEKAVGTDADCVFLDLEDAVAPDEKAAARENVIAAVNDLDWRGAGKTISVRVNGLDTQHMYRDVIEVVERAGASLDTLLIPKVGVPGDVYAVDVLVTQLEMAVGLTHRIGLEALIESPLGVTNVDGIARSTERLEALHFGPGDYAASSGSRTVSIGGLADGYPGDQAHFPLSMILVACRTHGLRAVAGAFGDFKDPAGFLEACKRAAALGYDGMWAIHPAQIAPANETFTPNASEVEAAERILDALAAAASDGKGAAQLDGVMIDAASARLAENVVAIAEALRREANEDA